MRGPQKGIKVPVKTDKKEGMNSRLTNRSGGASAGAESVTDIAASVILKCWDVTMMKKRRMKMGNPLSRWCLSSLGKFEGPMRCCNSCVCKCVCYMLDLQQVKTSVAMATDDKS